MNERVSWNFRRVYSDGLACMTLIRAGDLKSFAALRAANQYGLALAHVMEPPKEMNSSERNSLVGSAAIAGERNLPQPSEHNHPRAGCQAG